MFRSLSATAAALALCVSAATASPFDATVSTGESGQAKSENRGVIAFFVNQVATFIGFEAGHSDDVKKFEFYSDGQCEEAKAAENENGEVQPDETAAEPTGPEPIYFGF